MLRSYVRWMAVAGLCHLRELSRRVQFSPRKDGFVPEDLSRPRPRRTVRLAGALDDVERSMERLADELMLYTPGLGADASSMDEVSVRVRLQQLVAASQQCYAHVTASVRRLGDLDALQPAPDGGGETLASGLHPDPHYLRRPHTG